MCVEDTFLLLDALESDAADLKSLRPVICLEVGRVVSCWARWSTVTEDLSSLGLAPAACLRSLPRYWDLPSVCFPPTISAALLADSGQVYLCTDINDHACRCSQRTGSRNKVRPCYPTSG